MRRVSIAGLMVAIGVVALGITALKSASDAWTGALLMATLAVFATSTFGIAYRSGPARAGWFGFAVFGLGYLVLALSPYSTDQFRATLPTSRALAFAHARAFPVENPASISVPFFSGIYDSVNTTTTPAGQAQGWTVVGPNPTTGASTPLRFWMGLPDHYTSFEKVGHCLIAFVIGLIGSILARRFQRGAVVAAPEPAEIA